MSGNSDISHTHFVRQQLCSQIVTSFSCALFNFGRMRDGLAPNLAHLFIIKTTLSFKLNVICHTVQIDNFLTKNKKK